MVGALASLGTVARSLVTTIILLVAVILLASILGSGLALLGFVFWLAVLGPIAAGVFLIARAERPLAGVGAILMGFAVLVAFNWSWDRTSVLWSVLFAVRHGLAEPTPR